MSLVSELRSEYELSDYTDDQVLAFAYEAFPEYQDMDYASFLKVAAGAPEAAALEEEPDTGQGLLGDIGDMVQSGAYKVAGDVADFVGAEKFASRMYEGEAENEAELSMAQRAADEKRWLSDKEGELFGDAWSDIRSYAGIGSRSAASMAPLLASGGAGLLFRGGSLAARAAPFAISAAGEGAIEGASAARQAEEEILHMGAEELEEHEGYQDYLADGYSEEEARIAYARDKQLVTGGTAGLISGVALGGAGGAIAGKMARGTMPAIGKGGRLSATVTGAAAESVQEIIQTESSNLIVDVVGTEREHEVDFNELLAAGVGGAMFGGPLSAVTHRAKVQTDNVKKILEDRINNPPVDEEVDETAEGEEETPFRTAPTRLEESELGLPEEELNARLEEEFATLDADVQARISRFEAGLRDELSAMTPSQLADHSEYGPTFVSKVRENEGDLDLAKAAAIETITNRKTGMEIIRAQRLAEELERTAAAKAAAEEEVRAEEEREALEGRILFNSKGKPYKSKAQAKKRAANRKKMDGVELTVEQHGTGYVLREPPLEELERQKKEHVDRKQAEKEEGVKPATEPAKDTPEVREDVTSEAETPVKPAEPAPEVREEVTSEQEEDEVVELTDDFAPVDESVTEPQEESTTPEETAEALAEEQAEAAPDAAEEPIAEEAGDTSVSGVRDPKAKTPVISANTEVSPVVTEPTPFSRAGEDAKPERPITATPRPGGRERLSFDDDTRIPVSPDERYSSPYEEDQTDPDITATERMEEARRKAGRAHEATGGKRARLAEEERARLNVLLAEQRRAEGGDLDPLSENEQEELKDLLERGRGKDPDVERTDSKLDTVGFKRVGKGITGHHISANGRYRISKVGRRWVLEDLQTGRKTTGFPRRQDAIDEVNTRRRHKRATPDDARFGGEVHLSEKGTPFQEKKAATSRLAELKKATGSSDYKVRSTPDGYVVALPDADLGFFGGEMSTAQGSVEVDPDEGLLQEGEDVVTSVNDMADIDKLPLTLRDKTWKGANAAQTAALNRTVDSLRGKRNVSDEVAEDADMSKSNVDSLLHVFKLNVPGADQMLFIDVEGETVTFMIDKNGEFDRVPAEMEKLISNSKGKHSESVVYEEVEINETQQESIDNEQGSEPPAKPADRSAVQALRGENNARSAAGKPSRTYTRRTKGVAGPKLGLGSATSVGSFQPSRAMVNRAKKDGISAPEIFEVDQSFGSAAQFQRTMKEALKDNKFSAAVDIPAINDLQNTRMFMTGDGTAGFAITKDGELTAFFNMPAAKGGTHKGVASAMLSLGIEEGGTWATAFDTVLPQLYAHAGMKVVARTPFDERYKPKGWSYKTFKAFNGGRPDVVVLVVDKEYFGSNPKDQGKPVPDYDGLMAQRDAALEEKKVSSQLRMKIPGVDSDPVGVGLVAEDVDAAVSELLADLADTNAVVVQSFTDLPADIQAEITKEHGVNGSATQGVFDPATGTAYLVADNIHTAEQGKAILVHEVVGHGGLRRVFGDPKSSKAAKNVLRGIVRAYPASAQLIADKYGLDLNNDEDLIEIGDELLANMAETNPRDTFVRRAVSVVMQWIRKIMPNVKMSDTEVLGILGRMRQASRRGTGSVIINGESQIMNKLFGRELFKSDTSIDMMPDELSWRDKLQYALQDRFNSLKILGDAIAERRGYTLRDYENVYKTEELVKSRAQERTEGFQRQFIEPIGDLIKSINEDGTGIKMAEEFLHARHAVEANAALKRRGSTMDDPAGMSDKDATDILAAAAAGPHGEALAQIGDLVDMMNEFTLGVLENEGLESAENIQVLRDAYAHYVPLKRAGFDAAAGTGVGISLYGTSFKIRSGSDRNVEHIIPNLIRQAESALINAEKQKVGRALLNMVRYSPSDLWKINETKRTVSLDKNYQLKWTETQDMGEHVINVRENGKQYSISFDMTNEHVKNMVLQLKNQDSADMVPYIGKLMRFLSAVNTSWNPEFLLSNAFRDFQTAIFNLNQPPDATGREQTEDEYKAAGKNLMARGMQSIKGMWNYSRNPDAEWDQATHPAEYWAKRFVKAGGKTGWIDSHGDMVERAKEFERDYVEDHKGRKAWAALKDTVNDANAAIENGVRIAAFRNAVEAGASELQAASLAKNLTVNFNRRGSMGPYLNSAYLFYNASIQGSVRMMKSVATKRGAKVAGGLMVGAMMLDMMNRAMGDDDENGVSYYDKMDRSVKSRNIVIMIPGGGDAHVRFPLPWGYSVFHVMGQQMAENITGDANALEQASRIFHAVGESFNPMSGGSLLQTLSPTVLDPFMMSEENKTWAGSPLMPEHRGFGPKRPDSTKYWSSTSESLKAVSAWMNDFTWGDTIRPGLIDVSPETLEMMIEQATGGAGKFVKNTLDTGTALLTGDDINWNKVPIARKLFGEKNTFYDSTTFYKNLTDVTMAADQLKASKGNAPLTKEIRANYGAQIKLRMMAKASQKKIRGINKKRKAIERMKGLTDEQREERLDALHERKQEIYRKFNGIYNERVLGRERVKQLKRVMPSDPSGSMGPRANQPQRDRNMISGLYENLRHDEGVRHTVYNDDVGKATIGIGHLIERGDKTLFQKLFGRDVDFNGITAGRVALTDSQVKDLFDHDVVEHLERARKIVPKFDLLPDHAQVAIMNATYRGDLTGSPRTVRLINMGRWQDAAEEYLRHEEYLARKAKGNDGVVQRMERNAATFRSMA